MPGPKAGVGVTFQKTSLSKARNIGSERRHGSNYDNRRICIDGGTARNASGAHFQMVKAAHTRPSWFSNAIQNAARRRSFGGTSQIHDLIRIIILGISFLRSFAVATPKSAGGS